MKTEILNIGERPFLKVNLLEIKQKNGSFFVGKIPADQLVKMYTVEPAQYESKENEALASSFEDDAEYYQHLQSGLEKRIDSSPFQRKEEKERIHKIKLFLEESEVPFFPNSVIVTCGLMNDHFGISTESELSDEILSEVPKNSILSFFQKDEDGVQSLFVPIIKNALLVIDGQHRIKGLEAANEAIQANYDVLMVFIIGFDKSVVANLFYTVNYHQKSVNKSLLYHLTGEFSRCLDEVTFFHQVVKLLNELEKSPLCTRIKMLGVSPTDLPANRRRLATISQAFVVDELLSTINAESTSSIYQPIFHSFYVDKKLQIEIPRILIRYLSAVRSLFPEQWENVDNSVVSKSISIGAFLKVFRIIFVKMFVNDFDLDPSKISGFSELKFREALSGVEDIDFSTEGEYGRVGSGGSLSKIKREIIENAHIFAKLPYDQSVADFKSNELLKYRKWRQSNS